MHPGIGNTTYRASGGEQENDLSDDEYYDALKQWVAECLIRSGWKEDVKTGCKSYIGQKGVNNVSGADEIIDSVKQRAQAMVPNAVKTELLRRLNVYLLSKHQA
eukprot:GHVU01202413.1.p4 GENE.GHVU01202413.1~~GHVU01202413.1.p4  ORF type:complete len:104 (+),score=21.17 GHVU01202413.1:424-735(+)